MDTLLPSLKYVDDIASCQYTKKNQQCPNQASTLGFTSEILRFSKSQRETLGIAYRLLDLFSLSSSVLREMEGATRNPPIQKVKTVQGKIRAVRKCIVGLREFIEVSVTRHHTGPEKTDEWDRLAVFLEYRIKCLELGLREKAFYDSIYLSDYCKHEHDPGELRKLIVDRVGDFVNACRYLVGEEVLSSAVFSGQWNTKRGTDPAVEHLYMCFDFSEKAASALIILSDYQVDGSRKVLRNVLSEVKAVDTLAAGLDKAAKTLLHNVPGSCTPAIWPRRGELKRIDVGSKVES